MNTVAVGALHDQQIQFSVFLGELERRVFQYRFVEPAEITGKSYGQIPAVFLRMQYNNSRPQDMPRIVESAGDIFANGNRLPVWITVEKGQGRFGILHCAQRANPFQLMFVEQFVDRLNIQIMTVRFQARPYLLIPFLFIRFGRHLLEGVPDGLVVQVVGVRFLYVRTVQQKIFTGMSGGPSTNNTTVEILPCQHRNPARMVDVSMGQNDTGQDPGIKRQVPVFFFRFFSASLEHSAIPQDAIGVGPDKMHRPCDFPYRAVEGNVHIKLLG